MIQQLINNKQQHYDQHDNYGHISLNKMLYKFADGICLNAV